jgi:hypothetical protein
MFLTQTLFQILGINITINASYQNSEVFNINAETSEGTSFSYSINNTFILNKTKTVALFLNYDQMLPQKRQLLFQKFLQSEFGIKVSLMEKQLQINATVTNIFAQRFRGDMYFNDNSQHFNNYWDGSASV